MRQLSNNTSAKCSALVPARMALAKVTSAELPGYVTMEEVHRALELATKPRVRLLLGFLWYSGARISEVLGVKVGDIDFRTGIVALATLKRRARTVRTIPLPPAFLGEVATTINADELKREDPLFPWSRSRAFELVRDLLVAAGVDRPRAHPHALRHGHAIRALEGGAPLNVVQRALGHASITTTSVYLAVTGQDVKRFYATMAW